MKFKFILERLFPSLVGRTTFAVASLLGGLSARANPTGGAVAQGAATFNSAGSQLTINQASPNAVINWSSFNIAAGETTTFVQPSSSSIAWNQINSSSPSQILGNLNANGFVILDNQSGFYVGGSAAIKTSGLVLTTTPTPAPNLSSGGAWQFDTPPPSAQIINYGQIKVSGGGPLFLIANDIQNQGTISAPGGKIGLCAGQQVLLCTSPDGRGLSAKVTLPQGSVDNQGKLIADAGTILAQAQTVNNNGLVQANSVQNINGVIELLASDNVNLGANSVISAQGAGTGVSSGGSVTIKSDTTFSDQAGSAISFAGGAQGGNGGQLEISAPNLGPIQSSIDGHAVSGFLGGAMTLDPTTVTLDAATESADNAIITSGGLSQFTVSADTINISSSWATPSSLSQLDLVAGGSITLNTGWKLSDAGVASALTLSAGNNIICNDGSYLSAGRNWRLNLLAGMEVPAGSRPTHVSDGTKSDGIYLVGSAYLQTDNGDINCTAANELLVGTGAIRTIGVLDVNNSANDILGGNINVTTLWGNVNTGTDTSGYNYYNQAPYYTPFAVNSFSGKILPTSNLGGVSTALGGNVTISAGGNVTSFAAGPASSSAVAGADPGAGAFGSQPGNVTITAGGDVYGHYVVADGHGAITAEGNIGINGKYVALSLVKGSWALDAPNGNIYLQEVRNPNGVFDGSGNASAHLFDYDPEASVSLNAIGVYLTGSNLPRPSQAVPVIFPPTLEITAGSGGATLGNNVILFPSADQNLDITTTDGGTFNGNNFTLSMSDTDRKQWVATPSVGAFTVIDTGSTPMGLNNPNPVVINISGDMDDVNLVTDKRTKITVGGNMNNCSFSGENLHSDDNTSIDVAGQIFNQSSFTWTFLNSPIRTLPSADWVPTGNDNFLALLYAAVDPTKIASFTLPVPPATSSGPAYQAYIAAIKADATEALLVPPGSFDQTFAYSPSTSRLTLIGPMTDTANYGPNHLTLESLLHAQSLTVLKTDGNGNPLVINGQLQTQTITGGWISQAASTFLHDNSQNAIPLNDVSVGYIVGGPGTFDVQASSISLGNSVGIMTEGAGGKNLNNRSYQYLAPYTPSGADLGVIVTGPDPTETVNGAPVTVSSLDMPAATIATLAGGNVTVTSQQGSLDLGSQDLLDAENLVVGAHGNLPLGIYNTGPGNVQVTARGDINVDSSRIAAFDGGKLTIESDQGSVNAGSGGANVSVLDYYYVDPTSKQVVDLGEQVYANGLVAETLVDTRNIPGAASLPGDISVTTPQGDIIANLGGILQEALNGNTAESPIVTLTAGSPGYTGNIELGSSGVIGGSVFATANGNISGLVVSRQNSTINAAQNFSGTVLAGGSANLSAGGSVTGTVVGLGGVNASGGAGVSASLLGNNVSVNGAAAQNTLGGAATATSTSQSAAGQASNDTKQELAATGNGEDDDKKKKKVQALVQKVKRVTVILPKT